MPKTEKEVDIKTLRCWKHKAREEIVDMIKEGRSDSFICKYLKSMNDPVDPKSVANFRKALTPEKYLRERFNEIDGVIDAVNRHLKLITLQETRIEELRKIEQKWIESFSGDLGDMEGGERGRPSKSTPPGYLLNRLIGTHTAMLVNHVKIKQSLGLSPIIERKMIETVVKKPKTDEEDFQDTRQKLLKKKAGVKRG